MAHMSLLHRIPPMISAIAFGYGVGMAAPEATIDSMQAAVAGAQTQVVVAPSFNAPPRTEARWLGAPLGGQESSELERLRAASGEKDGAACSIEGLAYSRLSRTDVRRDGLALDTEALDDAGNEALSRLQLPDLNIPVSKSTLKYVRFFTRSDRGRGMFETWLKRSGTYQDMIQAELRQWRLPEDLMWVAMIESGFDAKAKSPAGAMGLWQFMPATGAVYGLKKTATLDQRRNPRLATQAAAHHLRDLYMRFGAWELALAAYNMGYEQLLDAIDRYGTTDFTELARQEAIPSETASYVPKIAAAAIVANNLDHFGFGDVELAKPLDVAEIAVPSGVPLASVAKAAGISTAKVRSMNADVLGDRVPRGHGDYLLVIPAESLARAQAMLPSLVEGGMGDDDDVLSAVDPTDLLGGRAFSPRRATSTEDSLLAMLPKPKRQRTTLRDVLGDDADDSSDGAASRGRSAKKGRETLYYRVGPGDTMLGVARQFAVDVDDIASDNGLAVGDDLRAGALLRLSVSSRAVKPAERDERSKDKGAEPKGESAPETRGKARGASQKEAPKSKAKRG